MEYRTLGRTGLRVSLIGLGTMTFGEQNSEAEAHAQIDRALDAGVTLIDTSEMYSVPPHAETYGATERIIGTWIRRSGRRDQVVLCTKVAGPGHALGLTYVRGGANLLDRRNIVEALDASLRRLQTDYVDLYQVHWPARATNFFGRMTSSRSAATKSLVPLASFCERTPERSGVSGANVRNGTSTF